MPSDRPPIVVSQTALQPVSASPTLAGARLWILEAELIAEEPMEVSVDGAAEVAVSPSEYGEDYWDARAEDLDVFRQPESLTTVVSNGFTTSANPIAPRNVIADPLPLGDGTPQTLQQFFAAFMEALEGAPAPRLEIWYRHGSPSVSLPIVLIPDASEPQLAELAADAVKQWFASQKPPTAGAQIALRFITPMLRIEQATIEVAEISDLADVT
jgi:hypothetical protein